MLIEDFPDQIPTAIAVITLRHPALIAKYGHGVPLDDADAVTEDARCIAIGQNAARRIQRLLTGTEIPQSYRWVLLNLLAAHYFTSQPEDEDSRLRTGVHVDEIGTPLGIVVTCGGTSRGWEAIDMELAGMRDILGDDVVVRAGDLNQDVRLPVGLERVIMASRLAPQSDLTDITALGKIARLVGMDDTELDDIAFTEVQDYARRALSLEVIPLTAEHRLHRDEYDNPVFWDVTGAPAAGGYYTSEQNAALSSFYRGFREGALAAVNQDPDAQLECADAHRTAGRQSGYTAAVRRYVVHAAQ